MRTRSTYQAFEEIALRYAQKTALIYIGERYSYADLRKNAARAAKGLRGLGIEQGDRVMIYTPNCPQWVITWLGLQRLGALAVPVSFSLALLILNGLEK